MECWSVGMVMLVGRGSRVTQTLCGALTSKRIERFVGPKIAPSRLVYGVMK
jgi:hypothetical protein